MRKSLIIFLGTGLGTGYIPLAPGTMGTLVGVILYLVLSKFFSSFLSYALMSVAFIGFGIWISGRCEDYLKKEDNPLIVIDEMGGFLITMCAQPFSFRFILLGFILFRAFDIFKPFHIDRIQKLPAGWGIMGDDLAAGILANLMLWISRSMFGW